MPAREAMSRVVVAWKPRSAKASMAPVRSRRAAGGWTCSQTRGLVTADTLTACPRLVKLSKRLATKFRGRPNDGPHHLRRGPPRLPGECQGVRRPLAGTADGAVPRGEDDRARGLAR